MTTGKTARRKGHNFEREVAIMLRPYFPDAKRQLEYQEGLGYDIHGTDNLSIQCKVGKSFKIENALAEAIRDDFIPVAITKRDREDIVVSLYWKDFEYFLVSYLKENNDKTSKTRVQQKNNVTKFKTSNNRRTSTNGPKDF